MLALTTEDLRVNHRAVLSSYDACTGQEYPVNVEVYNFKHSPSLMKALKAVGDSGGYATGYTKTEGGTYISAFDKTNSTLYKLGVPDSFPLKDVQLAHSLDSIQTVIPAIDINTLDTLPAVMPQITTPPLVTDEPTQQKNPSFWQDVGTLAKENWGWIAGACVLLIMKRFPNLKDTVYKTMYQPAGFERICNKIPILKQLYIKSGIFSAMQSSPGRAGATLNLMNNTMLIGYGATTADLRMVFSGGLFFIGNIIYSKNKAIGTLFKVFAGAAMFWSAMSMIAKQREDREEKHIDPTTMQELGENVKLVRGVLNTSAQLLMLPTFIIALQNSKLMARLGILPVLSKASGFVNLNGAFTGIAHSIISGNPFNLLSGIFNYGSGVADQSASLAAKTTVKETGFIFKDVVFPALKKAPGYLIRNPIFTTGTLAFFYAVSQIPKLNLFGDKPPHSQIVK